jgi:hypothetical protein
LAGPASEASVRAISAVLALLSLAAVWVSTLPAARGHFGHERHFRGRRFAPGFYDYDYGCNYGYPYYTTSYSCYPSSYF